MSSYCDETVIGKLLSDPVDVSLSGLGDAA